MDAKERIVKAMRHEEPDKVPSFEISIDNLKVYEHFNLKYGYQGNGDLLRKTYDLVKGDTALLKKFIDKSSKVADTLIPGIELCMNAGIDLYSLYLTNYPVEYTREGIINDVGAVMHFKKNPADNMDILYYMGGFFQDFEDYEEFPKLDPDDPKRESVYRAGKLIEEKFKGKVYVMPSFCGLLESAWQGFGLQQFSRMLAKPKIVKQIFDDRGKFQVEMIKRLIEWGEEGAVLMGDDYGFKTGLLMAPHNYNKFVFPWLKRMCETAHKGGLKYILHSCGDIFEIFEDIINCGVDAIHPIEPTTSNPEFNIFKLHEKYGHDITFIGNVSPQDLADQSPEFIRNYVKELIQKLAPGGGFILSSGHSINPAVKLENFLAMHETLKTYGKYPIQVN
ncbi:MAG: uroporphyrinogen decarboxylase family protein [Candidatus Hermodarchaeota archaeon]